MHSLISSTDALFGDQFRNDTQDDSPVLTAQKQKADEALLRKRFAEQVRLEEARFRQWEQKLISERDRLNKDLEEQHRQVKELEMEMEQAQ